MSPLLHTGKYVAINDTDTTTVGYYIVEYVLYTFALHEDITSNGKVSNSGELVVK